MPRLDAAWTSRRSSRSRKPAARLRLEALEERLAPALDFGDAPDLGVGTGRGNYATLLADDGPRHTIVPGLRIGASVDGEANGLPSAQANGDDVNQALPDDEDGLVDPLGDLTLTVGAAPTVAVRVTNTTGTPATLFGWIDTNADGIFAAGEGAQVPVPTGTTNQTVMLSFPAVPAGFTGTTYARFRLGTTVAVTSPMGAAPDGEVEDYRATIINPTGGLADAARNTKIGSGVGGGPNLANLDQFGRSVAVVGDIDGDGVPDLAVGAPGDDTGGSNSGAVHVLFLTRSGTVRSSAKIANGSVGGLTLAISDNFGVSVAAVGDLDGDGVPDLVVGASGDDTGGTDCGAVYVLLLNANGTVKGAPVEIASATGGGPTLVTGDNFGSSVTSVGDLDGDGVPDLAVGAPNTDTAGSDAGAVYVLFLNTNGTVKGAPVLITNGSNGGPGVGSLDRLGRAVTGLGDLDGDGVPDLAVAADQDTVSFLGQGAVHILFLNATGTVKGVPVKLRSGLNGVPTATGRFGRGLAAGDLNGDGTPDLIAGADSDDTGGTDRGATFALFLNPSGTVRGSAKIAHSTGGGPVLSNQDGFGSGVALLGDLDGDRVPDLAVGAPDLDTSVTGLTGTVHVLFLLPPVDHGDAPDTGAGAGVGNYQTLTSDNGPRHTVVPGLRLGSRLDGEPEGLPGAAASGDDTNQVSPDDEDGLVDPARDLMLTVGTAPTVAVRVTNLTGNAATLTGWIDYDRDGVFEAGEQALVVVPAGTNNGLVVLTFPPVPPGVTGATYARFRLGTTAAATAPTGAAPDGEVEDYPVAIVRSSSGAANPGSTTKITTGSGGGPTLLASDNFGQSVTVVGDVDGDGIPDLAVGAPGDDTNGLTRGAVYILFMTAAGTVKGTPVKIADSTGGGPTFTEDLAAFGRAVAAVGDLDGDGVPDIAVGSNTDGPSLARFGSVFILFLNSSGTVKSFAKIGHNLGGGPSLTASEFFGASVASVGDLDGDGVTDLAVGSRGNDTNGSDRGAVYILFLNSSGTVKGTPVKIASGTNGGPTLANGDTFGTSVASLGDLDGDGLPDLAVGALNSVHILFLTASGAAKGSTKIPAFVNGNGFGTSLAALGDLDGDGRPDLAVGASNAVTGGAARGALHLLRLKADGTVKGSATIASDAGGGPAGLASSDRFGSAVAALGDLDGDGLPDLVAGASGDDSGVGDGGAVYVLRLTARTPTSVVLNDGAGQSGTVSTPVGTPPSVLVSDGQGPLSGVVVTFTITAGGGSLIGASAVSDTNGVARLGAWVLGATLGSNTVTAAVPGFNLVPFSASGALPEVGAVSPESQSATVGTAVAARPIVRVTDALGAGRAGVAVTFTVSAGGGTVTAGGGTGLSVTVFSNAQGFAALDVWTLGAAVGAGSVTATVAGYLGSPVTFTATATAGAPASLGPISADNQPGVVGAAVAGRPTVVVRDAFGNPVPGVGVTFAVASGGGTLPGGGVFMVTTDAAGVAAVDWILGTVPGVNALTASVAGLPAVTFTATAQPGASAQLVFATQPRTVVPGQLITPALVVLIQDRFGNVVTTDSSIVSIDLGNNPGAAILGGNRAVNAVNGRAEFNVLFLTALGSGYNLVASNSALQRSFSAPFDVRAASLVSSTATSLAGEAVTFTFRAFSLVPYQGTPFGTATFSAGGVVLGKVAVNSDGLATLTTADLPVSPGGLVVTAVYNDGLAAGVVLVGPRAADAGVMAETTITVVGRTDLGVPVTIVFGAGSSGVAATLADGAGSGSVAATVRTFVAQVGQFLPAAYTLDPRVGDNPLFSLVASSADTVSLVANFAARFAARRSHTVTIIADVGLGSVAQTFTVFVGSAVASSPVRTVATLSSSASSSRAGEALRFTASVAGSGGRTPVGSVLLVADGDPVGALTLVNGQATFTVTNLGLGRRFLSVVYTGDGEANASTSAPPLEVRVGDAVPGAVAPAKDSLGVWDPATATWYVLIQGAARSFVYGLTTWTPIVGDWDGDGVTTIGTIDPVTLTWYLRNSNTAGPADAGAFQFGVRGWTPVVGDWNGDGKDDLGIFDPFTATWYLFNQGVANKVQFGVPGWTPVVGDWTKAGRDSIGLFDPANAMFYQLTNLGLNAFQFGVAGWKPVAGDWDGDGLTSVGVIEPVSSTWYLRGSNTAGVPDAGAFQYGVPGWVPLRGAWEGRARAASAEALRDLAAVLADLEARERDPLDLAFGA